MARLKSKNGSITFTSGYTGKGGSGAPLLLDGAGSMSRPVECSYTPTCQCFGCHARSISFAAPCTPTRRRETVRTNAP